ncbi:MAG: Hpt domain-containing protein, partial [Burkholderiaceae bacterium]
MDLLRDSEFPPDLSPLAWVQEELRRSLEAVHKALRRTLRDGDARLSALSALGGEVTPSQPLQQAAAQLHQVAGVLALVGLPAGAALLRAAEVAVERLALNPTSVDLAGVETIERADFALLSLMARMLAGNKSSTLALFPAYRELQAFNGVERIHPADLWQYDWQWRDLPADASAVAVPAESVRASFEAALLKVMRTPTAANARALSDLCAALAAGLNPPNSRILWQLAAAVFEAQAEGLLDADAYVKRLGSRLLSQLRVLGQGDAGLAGNGERLAQDLLFFCAQSSPAPAGLPLPRLRAVWSRYNLGEDSRGDYEDESLGKIDPSWVSQARRRVLQAKESWSSAAEGETHRLAGLDEQFAALAESLERLFPSGEVLGQTLQRAVVATVRSAKPPPPPLAMEVATSMLYVEAALDDAAFDQPEQAERVKRLAQRIEAVAHGEPPEPLEDWMEELYRRVSDRQTLGSVVHELRASLSEIERQADEYFRTPSQRQLLIPVPGQLQAMRGVLTVLGLDQAALACLRMRDEIDELANTEIDPERSGPRELFERLANNLGALGFLIDMLSVQPALAKRMFHFDAASGRLDAVMGRHSNASPLPPASEPVPLDMPAAAFEAAQDAQDTASAVDAPPLERAVEAAPVFASAPAAAAAPVASVLVDPEMQEIFLEEATEVLANARRALELLNQNGSDREQLTTLRRAFHTLKGSSRMVGFDAYGEGAWACEQLFNARLAEAAPAADSALLNFSTQALDYLAAWCEQIAGRAGGEFSPEPLRRSADSLRLQGQFLPLEGAGAASPTALEPADGPLLEIVEAAAEPIEVAEVIELDGLDGLDGLSDLPVATLEPAAAPESLEPLATLEFLQLPESTEPAGAPLLASPAEAAVDSQFDLHFALTELQPDVGATASGAALVPESLPEPAFELHLDLDETAPAADAAAEVEPMLELGEVSEGPELLLPASAPADLGEPAAEGLAEAIAQADAAELADEAIDFGEALAAEIAQEAAQV